MESCGITCCLPVEIKTRDLDARLLLACHLVAAGFDALLGSKLAINSEMLRYPPFLYFDKGLTPDHMGLCRRIHDSGGFIINLDEEGGVIEKGMFTFLVRYPDNLLPFYDVVCLWGEQFRECLLKNRPGLDPEKLFVTGHPRFDLRKEAYFDLYSAKASALRDQFAPFLLVNTSFAYANHVLGYDEGIRAFPGHFGKEDALKEGVDAAYYRLVQYYMVKAVRAISTRRPELTIIFRPHPSESAAFYRDAFRDYPKVHITQEGSVQEWIIGAEIVLHHDCTTAIEAAFANRKVISYAPIRDNDLAPELPMLVSDIATTEDELVGMIAEHLDADDQTSDGLKRKSAVIEPWIHNVDAAASGKIVDVLLSRKEFFLSEWKRRRREGQAGESLGATGASLLKRLMTKGKRVFCPSKRKEHKQKLQYMRQKMPGVSMIEIKEKISSLACIEPAFNVIEVEQFAEDGFRLSGRDS